MGDKVFSGLALLAGVAILATLVFVAVFLSFNSVGAVYREEEGLIIRQFLQYAYPLVIGTLIASLIALLLATPVAVGVALYISHFAPPRLSKSIGYVIDLLAAIPSVVYGAWGMSFLGPTLVPLYGWLHQHLSFIPLFAGSPSQTGRTIFTAGVVLAVMILPIITSVCREIFIQTPKLHEEAALALGATRWEMITMAVFPFARAGIISGVMLGLGRALGETMAVALVLSPGLLTASLISAGNSTIPAEIALGFPEAPPGSERQAQLIAIGLVLFIITLIVNMTARWIVSRHKEFSGAN
ncbi:phosphate ABC transporter permease subunit PstC [Nesterenkonia sphaerica]|uniref:Phosphate transport system permease protein n=1 Tax=Nesterenkonia sphaerica TaxID=1804988 RepID=A0A5R9A8X0_9MICC|nr:phosphate ABC transporter permease subunit PstC [Nesterenkonia sphaerica]TLP74485.1 phosphate ABC transporter permease subunit PstC [Nesterenkonia sphaerica]